VGIEFTLTASEPLDRQSAERGTNYRLMQVGSGEDVSHLITDISMASAGQGAGATIVVRARPVGGLAGGVYELTFFASNVTDLAGNPMLAADARVRHELFLDPPSIATQPGGAYARPVALLQNTAPELVVVGFSGERLEHESVEDVGNYALERLGPAGGAIEQLRIEQASYDELAGHVLLSGFGPLPPGTYRVTVHADPNAATGASGIRTPAGVRLDADGDGSPGGDLTTHFHVVEPSANAVIDEELVDGTAEALEKLAVELLPQLQDARDAMLDTTLAGRLLDELQTVLDEMGDAPSGHIARSINERLQAVFLQQRDAEYQLHDFAADDYVIAWGHGVWWQLTDTNSQSGSDTVGLDARGDPINEIPQAVVSHGERDGVPISVAIVPAHLGTDLIATGTVRRKDGAPPRPPVVYEWQTEAAGDAHSDSATGSNQAGMIALAGDGTVEQRTRTDLGVSPESESVDLSERLTADDPLIEKLNDEVLRRINQLRGPGNHRGEDLLVLWFDPIDYRLSDQLGQTSVQAGSHRYNRVAGAFFAERGYSELLVIPGARADLYTLTLVGLGTEYRGAANFLSANSRQTATLYGRLSRELQVHIDFRQDWSTPPSPSPPNSMIGLILSDNPESHQTPISGFPPFNSMAITILTAGSSIVSYVTGDGGGGQSGSDTMDEMAEQRVAIIRPPDGPGPPPPDGPDTPGDEPGGEPSETSGEGSGDTPDRPGDDPDGQGEEPAQHGSSAEESPAKSQNRDDAAQHETKKAIVPEEPTRSGSTPTGETEPQSATDEDAANMHRPAIDAALLGADLTGADPTGADPTGADPMGTGPPLHPAAVRHVMSTSRLTFERGDNDQLLAAVQMFIAVRARAAEELTHRPFCVKQAKPPNNVRSLKGNWRCRRD